MNDSEIEQETGCDFHFVIGITVSGIFDGEYVTPHVVAAIAELESSRDFRNGTLPDGYVFEHKADFDRITVTTQINRGRRPVLTEGDAQADIDGTRRPDNHIEDRSAFNCARWAEDLIKQLPGDHDGRNSWLLNYGSSSSRPG